ncbi:hypothetical protein PVAR5_5578 [Paecilomyces variotii No. 5]|uniref:Uncharacterized protein n=1 Tax=Byssochlamys spectabilis (strain No. 5 / NBRC 109023) TaxID=1356009 RepID=V5G4I8_BYSSN|nr:hypothetical protein PVAR5_5578 [Paecilomyces variotii No. 5]
MSYELSIEICGQGEDPNHRCHWGFMINRPAEYFGDLLHVRVIDLDRLWYQFEYRSGSSLDDLQAVGKCKIADLTLQQRQEAIELIKAEKAPIDGKRRCQDWVFDTLISLEVEDLVPPGTAEFWKGMIGKPAKEVRLSCGVGWTSFNQSYG